MVAKTYIELKKEELFLVFETDVVELLEEWKMSSWEGSSGVAR